MAWYDNPALYYRLPSGTLAPGDIVIVAVESFTEPGYAPDDEPLTTDAQRLARKSLASGKTTAQSKYRAQAGSWRLAIVLPHACTLVTEIGKRIAVLELAGYSRSEAERLAGAEISIEPFVALAPICTYGELAPERHASVQIGADLAAFPVLQNGPSGIPPGWVDLARIVTIDEALVAGDPLRVAAVTSLVQAHLELAVAKYWAHRDISRFDPLQHAFGQRIADVVPLSTGKSMRLGFTLEDGTRLAFDASDKPLPPPSTPSRRPRPSRN